jgi:hypothetical protein
MSESQWLIDSIWKIKMIQYSTKLLLHVRGHIKKLMGFKLDWNKEIIDQFYATL